MPCIAALVPALVIGDRYGADALWVWMHALHARGAVRERSASGGGVLSSRLLDDPGLTATRQLLVRARVTRSQTGVVIVGHGSPSAVCARR